MPRPPASLFESRLACAEGAKFDLVLRACEAAGWECGLAVVCRTDMSVVFLPRPGHSGSRFGCLITPAGGSDLGASGAGLGVTAEIIAGSGGECLEVLLVATSGKRGRLLASTLGPQLLIHRVVAEGGRRRGGGHDDIPVSPKAQFGARAASYYNVAKALSDNGLPPGAAAARFVHAFRNRYADSSAPAVSNCDKPMAECQRAAADLCRMLQEHTSLDEARKSSGRSSRRCSRLQASVERYLFSHVGASLWRHYADWYATDDERYARRAAGLRAVSDAQIFEALEVRPVFQGDVAAEHVADAGVGAARRTERTSSFCSTVAARQLDITETFSPSRSFNESEFSDLTGSTAACTEDTVAVLLRCSPSPRVQPGHCGAPGGHYARAAVALSQLERMFGGGSSSTPRDGVEALALAQLELKTCALDASNGQMELAAMDDLLPLFIFVLVRSEMRKPLTCARFMHDALSLDERLDSEGRAVTLLEAAALHIMDDRDIEALAEGHDGEFKGISPRELKGQPLANTS